MIYNIRHWSNDTTENQKEKKPCFKPHFENFMFLEKDVVIKKLSYVKV